MKKSFSLIMSLVMLVCVFAQPVSAAGYLDSTITIDGDLSEYNGEKTFDDDYCYGYNDFENVTGYTNTTYKIIDTGDTVYKKALDIPAFNAWESTLDYTAITSAKYTYNSKIYSMFNESVTKDDYYILSYDYKSEIRTTPNSYKEAFSLAPRYSVFNGSGDVARNYATYYEDLKWHSKAIGFKAEDTTLKLRIHPMVVDTHSYVDNLLLMKAATVILNDASETSKITDLNGNILNTDDNKAEYPLITMGESAKFSVNAKRGMQVIVKMGSNVLKPDSNGVYSIEKVTDNITVDVDFTDSIVTSNYYVDTDKNVYLPLGSTAYALAEQTGFSEKCFKAIRNSKEQFSDTEIVAGDTVKLVNGDNDIASFTAKLAGDTNNDGKITVTDVTAILQKICKNDNKNANVLDQNGDQKLTASDVVYMRDVILRNDLTEYTPDNGKLQATETYINDILTKTNAGVTLQDVNNGIYSEGNRAAVANVMKKAMRGEDITIACFGGSITAQAGKTDPASFDHSLTESYGYVDWVNKWWKDNFESYGGKVTTIYAGIGATDTVQRLHTMYEDVVDKGADLVITEWACNDGPSQTYKAGTYEAMIRNFIKEDIAVVVFGMSMANKSDSQDLHRPFASQYNVPFVSYLDAYGDNSQWEQFTKDTVHPNVVGHALAGLVLNNYFNTVYADIENIGTYTTDVPDTYVYDFAKNYEGTPYYAKLCDIAAGKFSNIRIVSYGSFKEEKTFIDEKENLRTFDYGFRKYECAYSATVTDAPYKPMIIEVDDCKTASILTFKSYNFKDAFFDVTVNGVKCTEGADSFTCRHSTGQTEGDYQWTTYPITINKVGTKVRIEILPTTLSQYKFVNSKGHTIDAQDYIRLLALCLTK